MKPKVSITERLIGSIHLDDQKLIDEIIESEIWDYDEDLECMADWPSDSEKTDHEATTPVNEKHMDPSGESLSPIDSVRQWQSQNPGKGDYSEERSPECDLRIDEIPRNRRRSEDGLRARLCRRGSGGGSGELLQSGKRIWVDAGTVEPHGSDRV